MKFLKWIVLIRNDSGKLYFPVSEGRYLSGVVANPSGWGYSPVFGDDPVLYPRRIARFQVSELRRVGYNVRSVPWILYSVKLWIQKKKANPWK